MPFSTWILFLLLFPLLKSFIMSVAHNHLMRWEVDLESRVLQTRTWSSYCMPSPRLCGNRGWPNPGGASVLEERAQDKECRTVEARGSGSSIPALVGSSEGWRSHLRVAGLWRMGSCEVEIWGSCWWGWGPDRPHPLPPTVPTISQGPE